MAHRVIVDGKWPKSGLKDVVSGAECEKREDNGLGSHSMDTGNNPRSDSSADRLDVNRRSNNGPLVPNRRNERQSLNQQGLGGRYGSIGLYWWQLVGLDWCLESFRERGLDARLIAFDMRLGKTPTAIALDLELRNIIARKQRGNNATLIVCPKSVISHWGNLLADMGVGRNQICEIDLPRKQALREILGHIAQDKRSRDAPARYMVINWDAVQTIRSELQKAGPWFHVIGDEIHRIKSSKTKRTESFKKIKCKQKTGLSGTPADNKPEDFWSVLNWLRPSEYSSFWNFVEAYCNVQVNRKTGYKYIDGVNWDTVDELRTRLVPFYIRRTLAEVAKDLPQKQRRTIEVDMGSRQRREYDELAAEGIVEVSGGDILTELQIVRNVRLQQMAIGCCKVEAGGDVHITDEPKSPKLNAIMELIIDDPESGPYIVLAQHHDTIRLLNRRLVGQGLGVASIIGTTPANDRAAEVERFQGSRADVFTGTIGACREGITLSRANTIIFVDRNWNANHNRQAEARADDVNSVKPVTIITLESKDSIDQDRRLKIDSKAEATDAITSTG